VLYYVSCTVNPILYNVMSRKFRASFRRTLCGLGTGVDSLSGCRARCCCCFNTCFIATALTVDCGNWRRHAVYRLSPARQPPVCGPEPCRIVAAVALSPAAREILEAAATSPQLPAIAAHAGDAMAGSSLSDNLWNDQRRAPQQTPRTGGLLLQQLMRQYAVRFLENKSPASAAAADDIGKRQRVGRYMLTSCKWYSPR
jgi:hypothetical protein